MVNILRGGISWEKIKRWVNIRIRIKDTGNTFVGEDSGKVTTGNYNNFGGFNAGLANTTGHSNSFVGYQAGLANINGNYNNFMGYQAGLANINGNSNNFMGFKAGRANTSGNYNNFIGYAVGLANTTGHSNNFVGYQAGFTNTSGYHNSFVGYKAGYSNVSGYHNVSIGYQAGYYEIENFKLFIDALSRTNAADARIKALIYGIFDAATANQLLRINGILQLTEIKNGTTQANAGAVANEVWKTNGHATLPDNVLMIGV